MGLEQEGGKVWSVNLVCSPMATFFLMEVTFFKRRQPFSKLMDLSEIWTHGVKSIAEKEYDAHVSFCFFVLSL